MLSKKYFKSPKAYCIYTPKTLFIEI